MLRSLIQETRQSAAKQERPNYMPRFLNHESEQEPSKWVYTPSSMSFEGNNRAKRELAPTRIACVASFSARVRRERRNESKKKKGMTGEGEGKEGTACPQTQRF